MNPAFSVIFFTTLSGMGAGLLVCIGIVIALWAPELHPVDPDLYSWITFGTAARLLRWLCVGCALNIVGLSSSMFHLGKPMRAWRAFTQWRTSWLSREGLLALLTFVPALILIVLLSEGTLARHPTVLPLGGNFVRFLGAILALLSILTIVCTAMIYASLKPIPAWRHPLVVPIYLAFGILTGVLLLRSMQTLDHEALFTDMPRVVVSVRTVALPTALVLIVSAMKLAYWRAIDRIALPTRESATALEGIGKISTFERPHTEANYLTREMGFVLARKHSRKLRVIALVLFAVVPLLALLAAWLLPAASTVALWIAAIAALLGAFVERWLFFAEAKHMVMLYY